ncbi:MAG: DMT family transporter [Gammaproteobacteria bacterium]|nr:DMT family transporter [Gammaproteobacteria bacterium]
MNKWKYFALLAAFCNASIGVFSKNIFNMGMSPSQVAFYKCLIAFLLLSLIHICDKNGLQKLKQLKASWLNIAICAFFGIFTLYFFETVAYSYATVSVVVFSLLGTSSITTFLMSYFLLKEKMTFFNILSFLLCLMGLFYIFNMHDIHLFSKGNILAMIAGAGYGLFLSLTKKLNVTTSNFAFLWWFIGFGTLYLFLPFLFSHPSMPSISTLPSLMLLSLVPTIGGYYCTAKALASGSASKVQLFELTEPIFASLLGFVFVGELLKGQQLVGAALILFAIYLSSQNPGIIFKKQLVKNTA